MFQEKIQIGFRVTFGGCVFLNMILIDIDTYLKVIKAMKTLLN